VNRSFFRFASSLALTLALATTAAAQEDDAALRLAEQDFTLVSLPTALRLPVNGSAFRVSHRFLRPLGQGDFGDLVGDLFGLDSGAQIGLDYRYGILRNTQIGFHRTNDKDIMFFSQYGLVRQGQLPMDVSILASIDGTNNFRDSYSPSLGVILSRTIRDVAAVYVEPMWVNNTNVLPKELADDNDTVVVGLGARIRFRPTAYFVAEYSPRAGFAPGEDPFSIGIEKRAGGHTFQLNFGNSYATTRRQIALGGQDSWYMGFNISRKFY
jgi:hypothetical protein